MDTKSHWERLYSTKPGDEVSSYQVHPVLSLQLLDDLGLGPNTWIIDVGGGDSRLVDHLLDRGLACVSVLDVSAAALTRARDRLGTRAAHVTWIEADVTGRWQAPPVDIWHDRAVFHFLATIKEREAYLEHLRATLKPGGTAIIATFALDGPSTCSGLPVMRYSAQTLAAELGAEFVLRDSRPYQHVTPSGTPQSFQYSRFRRL